MCWSFTASLSATKPKLHTQDISHGLGGFLLSRGSYVGIGVQGEACGEVTQHAGHGLDVHTILEGDGCKGVAEVMESDLRDTSPFQNTLQHIVDAVRGDGASIGRGEHILVIGLALLLPQDFDCLGRDAYCPVGVFSFQRLSFA